MRQSRRAIAAMVGSPKVWSRIVGSPKMGDPTTEHPLVLENLNTAARNTNITQGLNLTVWNENSIHFTCVGPTEEIVKQAIGPTEEIVKQAIGPTEEIVKQAILPWQH